MRWHWQGEQRAGDVASHLDGVLGLLAQGGRARERLTRQTGGGLAGLPGPGDSRTG